ncbi:MAG TPA: FAD-dependent thymidylate synthase [Bacillota bacterium]|nr:FAD-dependent thymidylate synthase [Bacillota bacterium]HOK68388.1 FAD-dependent thymidylate synthase [Bacillota bacterium]HPP85173.1 FAD-dependent thymidylate synthase [Bacillota bacterium]
MKVEILSYTPNGDKLIAAAAKLCYSASEIDTIMDGLTPEKTESFLNMLTSFGHESPFEHVSITFGIEGVSRAVLAQITRHRIASFSVQSQRYVNKENFTYIVPPAISENPEALAEFTAAMEEDRAHYVKLAKILTESHKAKLIAEGMDEKAAEKAAQKAAFEDARSVLPNACDTKIIMTMNVRSLYNFFRLRCCNRAQWEIRALATEMLRLCRGLYPTLFQYAGPSCLKGPCSEGSMTCGKAAEVRKKFWELK